MKLGAVNVIIGACGSGKSYFLNSLVGHKELLDPEFDPEIQSWLNTLGLRSVGGEGVRFLASVYATIRNAEEDCIILDNFNPPLDPRLCAKLMVDMVETARKYNKQIVVATHNPALLDGLDLKSSDQRLFVMRDRQLKRIHAPMEPVRLSEAFIWGHLGGLSSGF